MCVTQVMSPVCILWRGLVIFASCIAPTCAAALYSAGKIQTSPKPTQGQMEGLRILCCKYEALAEPLLFLGWVVCGSLVPTHGQGVVGSVQTRGGPRSCSCILGQGEGLHENAARCELAPAVLVGMATIRCRILCSEGARHNLGAEFPNFDVGGIGSA